MKSNEPPVFLQVEECEAIRDNAREVVSLPKRFTGFGGNVEVLNLLHAFASFACLCLPTSACAPDS